jgi:hypothetical protein
MRLARKAACIPGEASHDEVVAMWRDRKDDLALVSRFGPEIRRKVA